MYRIGLFCLLAMTLLTGAYHARVSTTYASSFSGKAMEAVQREGAALVGEGDIIPPFVPLSSYGLGAYTEIAVHDDYMFIIEKQRFRIVSYKPSEVGQVLGEAFHSVAYTGIEVSADGKYALLMTGDPYWAERSILLYDVQERTNPRLVDQIFVSDYALTFNIYGERLYINTGSSLRIYSWANERLVLRGATDLAAEVATPLERGGNLSGWRAFMDGNTLIVSSYAGSNGRSDIRLYNVADDTLPSFIGTIPAIGGVAIPANGYLYVRNGDSGGAYLDIWDIRNPTAPQVVATQSRFNLYPVAVKGTQIIFSDGYRLHLYDVSNPVDMRFLGSTILGSAKRVEWSAPQTLYIVEQPLGINSILVERFNFDDAFDLTLTGQYYVPQYKAIVNIDARYSYLFNVWDTGIEIYDTSNLTAPRLVKTVLRSEFGEDLNPKHHLIDGRLYLKRANDIIVLDVRDPLMPTIIRTVPLEGYWELDAVGNGYLYARKDNTKEVFILGLNASTGRTVTFAGSTTCSGLDAAGTLLVTLCGDIYIYDISNPTAPVLLSALASPLTLFQPTLNFPYLYVTTATQFAIYDVSSPATPTYMTSIQNPTNDSDVECRHITRVTGDFYMRQCSSGMADIVGLSDPYAPINSGSAYVSKFPPQIRDGYAMIGIYDLSIWNVRLPLPKSYFVPLIQAP